MGEHLRVDISDSIDLCELTLASFKLSIDLSKLVLAGLKLI